MDLMQPNLQRAKNQEPGNTNDSPKNPAKKTAHGLEPELTSECYASELSPLPPLQASCSDDLSTYCTNKHNSHHSPLGYLSHDVDTQCWALRGAHCRKSSGRSKFVQTLTSEHLHLRTLLSHHLSSSTILKHLSLHMHPGRFPGMVRAPWPPPSQLLTVVFKVL